MGLAPEFLIYRNVKFGDCIMLKFSSLCKPVLGAAHLQSGRRKNATWGWGYLQCYPRFKNLSSGCKSPELCVDVASDVGILKPN